MKKSGTLEWVHNIHNVWLVTPRTTKRIILLVVLVTPWLLIHLLLVSEMPFEPWHSIVCEKLFAEYLSTLNSPRVILCTPLFTGVHIQFTVYSTVLYLLSYCYASAGTAQRRHWFNQSNLACPIINSLIPPSKVAIISTNNIKVGDEGANVGLELQESSKSGYLLTNVFFNKLISFPTSSLSTHLLVLPLSPHWY